MAEQDSKSVRDALRQKKLDELWEKKEAYEAISKEEPNLLTASVGGFGSGLTAGFKDELEAKLMSSGKSPLSEDELLSAIRERDELRKKEFPIASTLSDVGGSIVGGGKILKGLQGLKTAGRTASYALLGAAEGIGRGDSSEPEDIAIDATIGAGLGLPFGPLANKVGNFIKKHGSELIKRAPSLFGAKAEKIIRDEALDYVRGSTPGKFNSALDEEAYIAKKIGNINYKLEKEFGDDAVNISRGRVARPMDLAVKALEVIEGPRNARISPINNFRAADALKMVGNFYARGGVAGSLGRGAQKYLGAGEEFLPASGMVPLPAVQGISNLFNRGDQNAQEE
jgi:hypothetical protein